MRKLFVLTLMVATSLLVADRRMTAYAAQDILGDAGLSYRTLEVNPPNESFMPDTFRYQVVYRWRGHRCPRWRTDVVYSTVVVSGDTLGHNMLNSELVSMMDRTPLPNATRVELTQRIVRCEQRRNGQLTSGPRSVDKVDVERLLTLHARWRLRPKPLLRF